MLLLALITVSIMEGENFVPIWLYIVNYNRTSGAPIEIVPESGYGFNLVVPWLPLNRFHYMYYTFLSLVRRTDII